MAQQHNAPSSPLEKPGSVKAPTSWLRNHTVSLDAEGQHPLLASVGTAFT